MSVNKELVFIHLDLHHWTGRKKNRPVNLGLGEDEKRDAVTTYGFRKTFDPKELDVFRAIEGRAERELARVGERTAVGFVFPPTLVRETCQRLEELKTEFYQAKDALIKRFPEVRKAWLDKNPDYAHLIATDDDTDLSDVKHQLGFDYQVFKIGFFEAVSKEDANLVQSGMTRMVEGIYDRLLSSVSKEADQVHEALHSNKRVDSRTVNPLRAIAEKLRNLAFLDRRIRPLYETIEGVIAALPKQGVYPKTSLGSVENLIAVLRDSSGLRKHLDGGTLGQSLSSLAMPTTTRKPEAAVGTENVAAVPPPSDSKPASRRVWR